MKQCPQCQASLADNARFCLHCMTPLNQKRVIPAPLYFPRRWLSSAAAVLALVMAVTVGVNVFPRMAMVSEEAPSTASVGAPTRRPLWGDKDQGVSTTPARDEERNEAGDAPEASVMGPAPHTTTQFVIPTRPGGTESTTARTLLPRPNTTKGGTTTKTTTSAKTTTTTTSRTTTTRTTAAVPTYPAVWDEQAVYYTEDGQAFEEVEWTYKPYWSDTFSYSPIIALTFTISKTCTYQLPLSGCIVVTGFDAPTANGYYRIPPAIDGKVVLGVDMSTDVSGACQFNDAAIAPTVKCITFPTEMLFLNKSTIDQCTNLERLYFDCNKLYMDPEALPKGSDYTSYEDLLRVYGGSGMLYDYDPNGIWRMRNYCEGSYDKSSNTFTRGYRVRYYNVCHYYTEDLNYWDQLYPR